LAEAQTRGWRIGHLWYTHAHFDHIGGAGAIADALNPLPSMAQSVDTSVSKPILDTYRRCLEQGVVAIARITETKWKPDSRKWSMAASLRKEQARLWTARMRLSQNLDRYGANVEAALKDDPHRPALKEISRAVLAAMNTSG
jgi:hypothetical protein